MIQDHLVAARRSISRHDDVAGKVLCCFLPHVATATSSCSDFLLSSSLSSACIVDCTTGMCESSPVWRHPCYYDHFPSYHTRDQIRRYHERVGDKLLPGACLGRRRRPKRSGCRASTRLRRQLPQELVLKCGTRREVAVDRSTCKRPVDNSVLCLCAHELVFCQHPLAVHPLRSTLYIRLSVRRDGTAGASRHRLRRFLFTMVALLFSNLAHITGCSFFLTSHPSAFSALSPDLSLAYTPTAVSECSSYLYNVKTYAGKLTLSLKMYNANGVDHVHLQLAWVRRQVLPCGDLYAVQILYKFPP